MLTVQIADNVTLEMGLDGGKVRRSAHLVVRTITPKARCAIEVTEGGWAFTPEPTVEVSADQRTAVGAAVTSAVGQYGLAPAP